MLLDREPEVQADIARKVAERKAELDEITSAA